MMSPAEKMQLIDSLFAHVWMVRTFLKHSEEAEEDDELCEVHRDLYDVMHALGPAFADGDTEAYFKQLAKKKTKFRKAVEFFEEIQPEVSGHMNFRMAKTSLRNAYEEILKLDEATS